MNIQLDEPHVLISPSGEFTIPIHQRFLSLNEQFPEELCINAIEKALNSWYTKMKISNHEDAKEYLEDHVPKQPVLVTRGPHLYAEPPDWYIHFNTRKNGFVDQFCIGRNHGGATYYNESESKKLISYEQIPKEILQELALPKDLREKSAKLATYNTHNTDRYSEALFHREWAFHYVNNCLRELKK